MSKGTGVPQKSGKTPSGLCTWFLYELLDLESEVEASLIGKKKKEQMLELFLMNVRTGFGTKNMDAVFHGAE